MARRAVKAEQQVMCGLEVRWLEDVVAQKARRAVRVRDSQSRKGEAEVR